MIQLDDLSEEMLLANLLARFEARQIYTAISSIVVAVNPFEPHDDLYTDEVAARYARRAARRSTMQAAQALADRAGEDGPRRLA